MLLREGPAAAPGISGLERARDISWEVRLEDCSAVIIISAKLLKLIADASGLRCVNIFAHCLQNVCSISLLPL